MSLLNEPDKFLNFEDEKLLNFYHYNIIDNEIEKNKISNIFKRFKI